MKKKLVFRVWFDKKKGTPLAINSKEICSGCPLMKKEGGNFVGYPPDISGIYVVDLDQKLGDLQVANKHIVPAEMEVIINTLET